MNPSAPLTWPASATSPTMRPTASPQGLLPLVVGWYASHRRDLPWRDASCGPWGVLVSEVMLQQTPVARVLPVWEQWMTRWPAPTDLARDPPAAAVAAWGRLGYPRRALRLHATARACVQHHDGRVPSGLSDLRELPGVGDYTAAAVATFAFGQRQVVLDTNVRRVLARLVDGVASGPAGAPRRAERAKAAALLPSHPRTAALWNAAVMELGALVCLARNPACEDCPLAGDCAWQAAGRPHWTGPPRRAQAWHGTDRQARGRLLAVVREAYVSAPGRAVEASSLESAWADPTQRSRALAGLLADGLLQQAGTAYVLPT